MRNKLENYLSSSKRIVRANLHKTYFKILNKYNEIDNICPPKYPKINIDNHLLNILMNELKKCNFNQTNKSFFKKSEKLSDEISFQILKNHNLESYFSNPDFNISSVIVKSIGTKKNFQQSQNFHRDLDSVKMFKIFIYLNDVVDENDGPFIFLNSDQIKYGMVNISGHIDDIKMNSIKKYDGENTFLGLTGESIAVNTFQCFHKGSRLSFEKERTCVILSCIHKLKLVN